MTRALAVEVVADALAERDACRACLCAALDELHAALALVQKRTEERDDARAVFARHAERMQADE